MFVVVCLGCVTVREREGEKETESSWLRGTMSSEPSSDVASSSCGSSASENLSLALQEMQTMAGKASVNSVTARRRTERQLFQNARSSARGKGQAWQRGRTWDDAKQRADERFNPYLALLKSEPPIVKPASLPRTVDALLSLELASEARDPAFSFCAIAAGALLISGVATHCTPRLTSTRQHTAATPERDAYHPWWMAGGI